MAGFCRGGPPPVPGSREQEGGLGSLSGHCAISSLELPLTHLQGLGWIKLHAQRGVDGVSRVSFSLGPACGGVAPC